MAVAPHGGATAKAAPERLFQMRGSQHVAPFLSAYDTAPDASRFLVRVPLESARTTPLQLKANWSPPRP
jgi:hypothetical protein